MVVNIRCWLEVLNSGSHGFHEVLGATKARLTVWGYLSFSLIAQTMFKQIEYKPLVTVMKYVFIYFQLLLVASVTELMTNHYETSNGFKS